MKKHTFRTVIIYLVTIISIIYVYPTIGWMFMSDAQREARREQWKQEDQQIQKPDIWRDTWKSVKRWAQCDRSRVLNLGLDLQGGVHMVVGFDLTQELKDEGYTEEVVQETILQRIQRRIDEFEAQEPIIQTLGSNQIQIQLPGEKDVDRAKNLIMQTAYLTFHIASESDETTQLLRDIDKHFNNGFVPLLKQPKNMGGPFRVEKKYIDRVRELVKEAGDVPGLIPEGKKIFFSQPPNPWDEEQFYEIYLLTAAPGTTGEDLKHAAAGPDEDNPPNWQIMFQFGSEGAKQFGELTEKNIGKPLAIVLDNVVVSAPVIRDRISSSGVISGSFTPQQASDLAIALNSGSMPVPIREDYTGVVGASLGADSIRRGVTSTLVGAVLVVLFMLLYYRVGGFIADFALILNAIIMLAAMVYFRGTLTLPGIAGFVLTIGMAVDANVLIFERIREELRNGKSLAASIEAGYNRAAVTILDSNITTLIAAAIMLQFGTGPIKGFAVTLAIGLCASVFTALYVTQAIFDFLMKKKLITKLTMMQFMRPDTKIRFLAKRNICFAISGISILAGLIAFGIRGSDNFGVDFTQGTNMTLSITSSDKIDIGEVRAKLADAGFDQPIVQEYTEAADEAANDFVVRFEEMPGVGEVMATRVQSALAGLCSNPEDLSQIKILREEAVGPAVGAKLRRDAISAILWSWLFMIAYMWFRFDLKFGIAAVIALVHDVLFTVGFLAITGREISMPVIAALLTIIGYSVNDTIVIFDRVRENNKLYRGRGYSFMEIMDLSINQTLSRTFLTSFTVLVVVIILLIFAGSGLWDFALALTVGLISGTYSTVFIAGALVYLWQQWVTKSIPTKGGKSDGQNETRRKQKEATV